MLNVSQRHKKWRPNCRNDRAPAAPDALLTEAAVGARDSKQPSNKIAIVVKATEPIEYLDVETMGFEGGRLRS